MTSNPASALVNGSDLSEEPLGSAQRFLVTVKGYVNSHNKTHRQCLGVAVAKDVILTAGHCVYDAKRVEVQVLINLDPLEMETIDGKSWRHHPMINAGYSGPLYKDYDIAESDRYHDIAVVLLSSSSRYAVPVSAAPRDFVPVGLNRITPIFYTFGYRRDSLFVQKSGFEFTTFDRSTNVGDAHHWFKGYLQGKILICEGDSGAPVTISAEDEFVEGKDNHYLVGIQTTVDGSRSNPKDLQAAIAHWGSSSEVPFCGRAITYIDIASHADWIHEQLDEMDPSKTRRIRFYGGDEPPEEAAIAAQVPLRREPSEPEQKTCIVNDTEDTGVNVRSSPNGKVVNRLRNGRVVVIASSETDAKGRPWYFVEGEHEGRARKWGYVFGELVECS